MIEKLVLDYLINQNVCGSKVYMEKPTDPPEEYILIEKTGSPKGGGIQHAVLAIQSHSSKSLLKAAELNERVIEALVHMPDTEPVYECYKETDYNFTNTSTKEYRYQAVFFISY